MKASNHEIRLNPIKLDPQNNAVPTISENSANEINPLSSERRPDVHHDIAQYHPFIQASMPYTILTKPVVTLNPVADYVKQIEMKVENNNIYASKST